MNLWVDDMGPFMDYDGFTKVKQRTVVEADRIAMRIPGETPGMEYIIRVKGCLGLDWSSWFGEMAISQDEERNETILKGIIMDPAELYGLISRLRNMGLVLISVRTCVRCLSQRWMSLAPRLRQRRPPFRYWLQRGLDIVAIQYIYEWGHY